MTPDNLRKLLQQVRRGRLSVPQALERLRYLPFEDLGFVKIDHHRTLRQGFPEVIFASGKSPEQVETIVAKMMAKRHNILITRGNQELYKRVRKVAPKAKFHSLSRAITIEHERKNRGRGIILVVSAGTADIPVAEEALVTAKIMGNRVKAVYDVGVAGLHRLLDQMRVLRNARAIICVAGMEGALPSVVGGLVGVPVIAVPTSIGYGASFEGLAALLGMLNSCSPNVAVVNIDNGFGAGCLASMINR